MWGPLRRPKKWQVVLLYVLGAVVFTSSLVGFVTGLGPYDIPPESRRLEDTLAQSSKLGLPMTMEELVGTVPSDESNAAHVVLPIIAQLDYPVVDVMGARPTGHAEDWNQLKSWLAAHDADLSRARDALTQRAGWYVERDYDLGPHVRFTELIACKNLAKALMARGWIEADRGDFEAGLREMKSVRMLSRHLASEPALIPSLVAVAVDSIALVWVEHYVDKAKGPADLEKLVSAIESTRHRIDARQAIRGEFYFQLNVCRNLGLYGGLPGLNEVFGMGEGESAPPNPSEVQRSGLPKGMFARASMTSMAKNWNQALAEFDDDGTVRRGWGRYLAERGREMEADMHLSEVLQMIVAPAYERADDSMLNHDVMQDVAVAFLRCLSYRKKNGRWPGSLADVDAEFADPFAPGQPIKASWAQNELRVWSVGSDRTDHGGKTPTSGSKERDTVFVWPPSLRPVQRASD